MPNGLNNLTRHIGQTVTIFTTSGGQSGRGFTGILAFVNDDFVRLILQIGSAPGCVLGNCCNSNQHTSTMESEFTGFTFGLGESDRNKYRNRNRRFHCKGNTLGSIADIPVCKIAALFHNSVGSIGW